MLKTLWRVLIITLALNFLAVAGGIGWLYQTHRLNHETMLAIQDVLFPKPVEAAPEPVKPDPTTQPILQLDELLAKQAGKPATEQVAFIRQAFDQQTAILDRRARELEDLQRRVDQSRDELTRQRQLLDEQRAQLEADRQQSTRLLTDKGFQDSLQLYSIMPGRSVKTIFMTLDESVIAQYLQAMPPRTAARITKEFKSPEESALITRVLERIRQAKVQSQTAVKD